VLNVDPMIGATPSKRDRNMTSLTHTPPPVDGIDEAEEFLRDHPNLIEPTQTDIEDFTGPTRQPVEQQKLHQPKKREQTKPKQTKRTRKTQESKKAKKIANRLRAEKQPLPAGYDDQPSTTMPADAKPAHQTSAAVENTEDGNIPETTPSPSAVAQATFAPHAGPRPLGLILSPAATPPVGALGTGVARVAGAVQRVVQAPMAIILSTLLALLAVVAQAHVNVRLLHGSAKPVSLFLLSIGASGLRKTTADDFVSEGAKWAEAALLEDQKEDASIPLWQRVVRTGTYEGLLRILKDGAGTIALLNDDAGSFFGGNAMSPENRMKTTAGLSQLWDGSAVNHVLADQERSINMSDRRFSAHLGIQPELMLPLLADSTFFNQGILARFLVSVPDSNIGYRPFRRPEKIDLKTIKAFAFAVRNLLKADPPYRSEKSHALKPRVLELSDDAFDVFARYADEVEIRQRPFGAFATLTGAASKFAENAIRIAGVLAYFEDQTVTTISEDQAYRAVELMRFYATEMVRLTGVQRQSPLLASAQKVLDWLRRSWNQPAIRFQDFCQRGPIRSAADNRTIIPVLEQHGWLVRVSGDGYAGGADVWAIVSPPAGDAASGVPTNVPTGGDPAVANLLKVQSDLVA
jgi:hypothetical protein